MSVIAPCVRDLRVPGSVGVLVTSRGVFFLLHDSTDACPTQEPHRADECGECLPVRPGFEPDQDGPDKPIYWMYGWDRVFERLERGESMFQILHEAASETPAGGET